VIAAQPKGRVPVERSQRRMQCRGALAAAIVSLFGGAAWAALEAPSYHVSQRGRTFQPGELSVKQGETVQLVNDDGDLLHHAYVDSEQFSFDSGDQEPGSKTNVVFTVPGTFTVLCGIHPKMKLIVHVK
jgi:plastocyanin